MLCSRVHGVRGASAWVRVRSVFVDYGAGELPVDAVVHAFDKAQQAIFALMETDT